MLQSTGNGVAHAQLFKGKQEIMYYPPHATTPLLFHTQLNTENTCLLSPQSQSNVEEKTYSQIVYRL